eukprot:Lankesteria_metandrocarpae@DN5350_c0_g1_i1.p2
MYVCSRPGSAAGNDKMSSSARRSSLVWRGMMKKYSREAAAWLCFTAILGVLYIFASDGTFSAILTLSSLFQSFAFLLLTAKVVLGRSSAGVSVRSLQLYSISTSCRLFCNLRYHSYLPVDKSGDWAYQCSDGITVICCLVLIQLIWSKYRDDQTAALDKFADEPAFMTILGPLILAGFLSLLVHPKLAPHRLCDIVWSFALYTECAAMLPQLFVMARSKGEVEAVTSHYVAGVAVSRILTFVFWVSSFRELGSKRNFNIAGWTVVTSHLVQLLVLGDFMFQYVRAVKAGKRLIISM